MGLGTELQYLLHQKKVWMIARYLVHQNKIWIKISHSFPAIDFLLREKPLF
jgi:hypothetical protein